MKHSLYTIPLITLFLITIVGCCHIVRYDGAYRGKVIDADTGKPIEGVVILGVWYTEFPTIAGIKQEFYDARETATNKNGDFSIPGQGPRAMSNLDYMHVLIFKAGYEYIGMGPWETFKDGLILSKKVTWKGSKVIVPLKKLTMKKRKKQGTPPFPPMGAPLKNVILLLREIDKDRLERGLDPIRIWNGEKYE